MDKTGDILYDKYLNGDNSAVEKLVKLYRAPLCRFICGIVGDYDNAEDITQETFVAVLVKKPKNKHDASFKTWLFSIGRNKAIDFLRKNSKIQKVNIDDYFEIADDSFSIESKLENEELNKALFTAMKKISPEYATVLYLTYFEKFKIEHISKILKKSAHSTSSLLYRAKAALKKELQKEGFDYEDR